MLTSTIIAELASIAGLRALVVTTLEDGLLYDTWQREALDWPLAEVAALLGDAARAGRSVAQAMGAGTGGQQLLMNAHAHVVLIDVAAAFVVGFCYAPEVPLGLARFHVGRLEPQLAAWRGPLMEGHGRGAEILAMVDERATDPDAARLRIAFQTGIAMESLDAPDGLTPEELERLERAACDVLGVSALEWS